MERNLCNFDMFGGDFSEDVPVQHRLTITPVNFPF